MAVEAPWSSIFPTLRRKSVTSVLKSKRGKSFIFKETGLERNDAATEQRGTKTAFHLFIRCCLQNRTFVVNKNTETVFLKALQ